MFKENNIIKKGLFLSRPASAGGLIRHTLDPHFIFFERRPVFCALDKGAQSALAPGWNIRMESIVDPLAITPVLEQLMLAQYRQMAGYLWLAQL
jgi:hypothetical protein